MAVGQILIDGNWQDVDEDLKKTRGRFLRMDSLFRHWIRADGSSPFTPESGRYHLYVSLACPWAHRTLIYRALKKLQEVISVSVVDPFMGERSWHFGDCEGCTPDHLYQAKNLYEIYLKSDAQYSGYVTVPVLWDKHTQQIVNNESSEIIRMLNTEFNTLTAVQTDFYPPHLRDTIDTINSRVYNDVNNGVYKTGFARTQEAYEEAFDVLFSALDWLEEILSRQRYLCGEQLSEADIRLFPTLVRFDAVYVGHFKCNRKRLVDYPNLWNYTRDIYQIPEIGDTVNLQHIKEHYYRSHAQINPSLIVPKGPDIDFDAPHERNTFA
ncbi:MAG: glutathione S-transferase family protein [Gammaproteobacteria bacterium]|nr:glutathione S-transferase family protein [Gammaproteobacteria bacterium]